MRETHYLPPAVLQTIEEAGSEAVVSMASLWEIAIKVSLNKLYLPKAFDELFPNSVPDGGLTLLLIEPRHLIAVGRMPFHRRDPFDRLLIAQAQVDGLTIITGDAKFPAYGVPLLW
jgi:PIN domain nuclease of toxin-antitoxin system